MLSRIVIQRALLLLISAFVLGACSNEDVLTKTTVDTVAYDGAAVTLDAEAEYEYGDLRTFFTVATDGSASLSLPTDFVNVHCFIRSTTSSQVTAVTLRWRRGPGNTLTYSYDKDQAFNLVTGEDPLAAGSGDWYIMGIVGGRLNATTGEVTFNPSTALGAKAGTGTALPLSIPFVFPWTKLNVVNVEGVASLRIPSSVQFKPQGVVLRHHITNEMYTRWRVRQIRMLSNVMSLSGKFVPSAPTAGGMPTWEADEQAKAGVLSGFIERPADAWSKDYTLVNRAGAATPEIFGKAIEGTPAGAWRDKTPADNQMYYLTWAMPSATASAASDPFTGVYLVMDALDETGRVITNSTVNRHQTFFSAVRPTSGKSYRVESIIKRPPMALEYMAKTNLSADNTFAEDNLYLNSAGVSTAKYYNLGELFANADGSLGTSPQQSAINLGRNAVGKIPAGWHVPGMEEVRGILGSDTHLHVAYVRAQQGLVPPTATTPAEAVWKVEDLWNNFINNRDLGFQAIYVYNPALTNESSVFPGARVGYALRWSRTTRTTERNLFLSAWRYEFAPTIGPENSIDQPALVITARYLGPASTLTIADIANKDWWDAQSVPVEDEAYRILPLTGYIYNGRPYLIGRHGTIMLSTSYKSDITQGDLSAYRPERNGVLTNLAMIRYASDIAIPDFPNDREGEYPAFNGIRWSSFSFPIRPFKNRATRQRFVPYNQP